METTLDSFAFAVDRTSISASGASLHAVTTIDSHYHAVGICRVAMETLKRCYLIGPNLISRRIGYEPFYVRRVEFLAES